MRPVLLSTLASPGRSSIVCLHQLNTSVLTHRLSLVHSQTRGMASDDPSITSDIKQHTYSRNSDVGGSKESTEVEKTNFCFEKAVALRSARTWGHTVFTQRLKGKYDI